MNIPEKIYDLTSQNEIPDCNLFVFQHMRPSYYHQSRVNEIAADALLSIKIFPFMVVYCWIQWKYGMEQKVDDEWL